MGTHTTGRPQKLAGFLVGMTVLGLAGTSSAAEPEAAWSRQIGTSGNDLAYAVTVDLSGNIYVAGTTEGVLNGSRIGGRDAFAAKYDTNGSQQWIRQFGSSGDDLAESIAVDATGNVYVAGGVTGTFGGASSGMLDAYLTKLSSSGTIQWVAQFGTSREEVAEAVATDQFGNVYVGGFTSGALAAANQGGVDGFTAKFNASGSRVWTNQFGTTGVDIVRSVAANGAGDVFASGDSTGSGAGDVFTKKLSAGGGEVWSQQIGTTGQDFGFATAADSAGNSFVAGFTGQSLAGPRLGDWDAFLVKYDATGAVVWSRQFGAASADKAFGMTADQDGNAYVTGFTSKLTGSVVAEAFLTKFDPDGNLLWTKLIATPFDDYGRGVAVDAIGNAYVAGDTGGNVGGPNAGSRDAFLVKLVPEPSALPLLVGSWLFSSRRIVRRAN